MRLKVLGCSGGIGGDLRTTSFLLNEQILIDCGTGISELELVALRKIRDIFLTHSHLDHIAGLPLLVDTIFDSLKTPLTVHATAETTEAIRKHIFNNVIWPDFSRIPTVDNPVMQYQVISPGVLYDLDGCEMEIIPVNHVVPTVGYRVSCSDRAFAFTGDTTTNDLFWQKLNEADSLDVLIAEVAFPNRERELCKLAHHYCPNLLAADLAKLRHRPKIYISHLKPGSEAEIMQECRQAMPEFSLERLQGSQEILI